MYNTSTENPRILGLGEPSPLAFLFYNRLSHAFESRVFIDTHVHFNISQKLRTLKKLSLCGYKLALYAHFSVPIFLAVGAFDRKRFQMLLLKWNSELVCLVRGAKFL